MPRIGILIVTHNSAGHIDACLEAVHRLRNPRDIVLVIDNGSDERVLVPQPARFIQNEPNLGFAGAVNQGFRALKDDVDAVLLLNPDVILTTPLDPLTKECMSAGLAGGRLTDASGNPQVGFSFRRFPTPLTLLAETIGLNRFWKSNPVNRRYRCLDLDPALAREVDQPAGAMLMIRKDVWLRLNGLDEQFHPVWFEDVDFCRRAAVEGFRARYVPSVAGIHEGGHSVLQIPNRNRRRHWYASLLRYSRKHFGRAGWGLVAGGVAVVAVARALGAVLRLRGGSLKEAAKDWMIARTALVYPNDVGTAGAADVRSCVSNEGLPSNENTERTLKRLHAR